ncbi:hypothetical protein AP460_02935 [Actinobacillus pleuropneumoniae]|nr:hypothetical protein AP518_03047 [Actinobacillus pleuropneumoniae]UKH37785.1 hypothetical protein D1101_09580 [Actinobacillus pleuropneumoniae serovar 8 str. 405]KIE88708.1 hypothetical protein AP460_02935 [Actinobacillus pleuropneumoniae]KIE88806.1 hypothetical protein AP1022_02946 [Actinobacillus pleuropneumoniae]KIE94402.1 hypothetical protein AP5651_03062 [Actinobacillus pleuropneumoniae]
MVPRGGIEPTTRGFSIPCAALHSDLNKTKDRVTPSLAKYPADTLRLICPVTDQNQYSRDLTQIPKFVKVG